MAGCFKLVEERVYLIEKKINTKPQFGIRFIAFVNCLAAILHLLFGSAAFIKLSSTQDNENTSAHLDLIKTHGFGIADLIWAVPLLFIGSIALWKLKPLG
jgi:hypothetical protein